MQNNLKHFGEVVLFDPTCLTNSLRLPFAFFLTVDGNGRTVVAAACIMANETFESFDWVMSQFRLLCICAGRIPQVFYTDRCAAIHRALMENFSTAHHLLCRWHLAKNIVKNLAGILKSSLSAFVNDFYRLAESNESVESFEDAWGVMLSQYGLPGHGFCIDLHRCRVQWARRFHKDVLDFGLTTTSRPESMNAWVKRLVDTRTRLATLFKTSIVDVSEAHMTKTMLEEIKVMNNGKRASLSQSMSPLFKQAACVLHSYPPSIYVQQHRLSNDYRGTLVDLSCKSGTIVHKTRQQSSRDVIFDPPSCTCGFFLSMGLPCRHYLRLASVLSEDNLPLSAFHRRWTREASNEAPIILDVGTINVEASVDVSSSLLPNRYDARLQKFKEVNRLFGDRLEQWLDVCLSGNIVETFPLPVLAMVSAVPVRDPATTTSRKRKRFKSADEMAAKRGLPIPQTPCVAKGPGRPKKVVHKTRVSRSVHL